MLTIEDLKDKLKKVDEISLLEVLEISSEDIIDRFEDIIINKHGYLVEEFEDETEEL
jgi:hypothetical protein